MVITNWKLLEIIESVEVIHPKSQLYLNEALKKYPKKKNDILSSHRTFLEWNSIVGYHRFFLDDKDESSVEKCFRHSTLKNFESLILTYGFDEPVVKIPAELFFTEWEEFLSSQKWSGFIFSCDSKIVAECSQD
ncbi:MAG: hypothetical protein EOO43_12780 [Flavobacterium sp.]|nr:MAG: hypothetical protein EOO43_12780 [Flavobacterium sp.]